MSPKRKVYSAKSRVADWLIDNRMRYCGSCEVGIGIKSLKTWHEMKTGMCPFCKKPLILRKKGEPQSI